jgi:membrane protein YdbS with pleckstrin-like domain
MSRSINFMNKKGSVEWRIVWMIIVIATAVVAILIIYLLYYASSHNTSPFVFFSNLFGAGA